MVTIAFMLMLLSAGFFNQTKKETKCPLILFKLKQLKNAKALALALTCVRLICSILNLLYLNNNENSENVIAA